MISSLHAPDESETVEKSNARLRKEAHLSAQVLLHQNRHEEAIQILELALATYGSHVGLLADLGSCYFSLQKILKWRSCFEMLNREFEVVKPKLSMDSRYRTEIILAKFEEEDGRLAAAIERVSRVWEEIRNECTSDSHQLTELILTHLVRIKSTIGDQTHLPSLYTQLLQIAANHLRPYHHVELQHALLTCEYAMMDAATARERYHRVVEAGQLIPQDHEWLTFDVLQLELLTMCSSSSSVQPEILSAARRCEELRQLNRYNLTLLSWATQAPATSAWRIREALSQMNLGDALRLAAIRWRHHNAAASVTQPEPFSDLQRDVGIILKGLAAREQKLWLTHFRGNKSDFEISIDPKTQSISFHHREVRLAKPLMIRFLNAAVQATQWNLEDFCLEVYGVEFNASYLDRIRMQGRRLDSLLQSEFGITIVHKITKAEVHFRSEVKVRLREPDGKSSIQGKVDFK